MIHIATHFVVPVLVALVFYRTQWKPAVGLFLGTMLVDLDHLLADPIYDPDRCSIGFHPLHTAPAIALYALLFLAPWAWRRNPLDPELPKFVLPIHLIGAGLLLHMGLDWLDCFV